MNENNSEKSIECFTIVDYLGSKTITNLNVNDLEGILSINMEVVTGDEIAEVVYEDGSVDRLDSSKTRTWNFNDCFYPVYNRFYGYNFFASDAYDKWKKEKDSYKRAEIAHEWAFENVKEDEEDIECIK